MTTQRGYPPWIEHFEAAVVSTGNISGRTVKLFYCGERARISKGIFAVLLRSSSDRPRKDKKDKKEKKRKSGSGDSLGPRPSRKLAPATLMA